MASKREIEAGKAVVVMGMDISPLTKGLDAAQAKLASFGKGVAAFGAGLAMAGALVTAPMLYGLSVFSEMGSEISKASRISGIGLEDLQTLSAALKVSFEELATASKKMDQFISHAAAGAPDAANRLAQLGLSVAELSQLSEGDRLRRIGEAINRTYSDVSQRHAAMTDVFGRNGLNLDFSGDVGGRENRRRELGGVMSPADVELAKEYGRAQKEMGIAIQGLWARIGSTAAPAVRDFFNLITRGVVYVQQLVDANRPLLEIVFRIADGMVTAGAVIAALGGAIYAASYAFLFIKGAILIVGSAITTMTTIATGGLGILGVASYAWAAAMTVASGIASVAMAAWGIAYAGATALAGSASAIFMGILGVAWSVVTLFASALWFVISGQLAFAVASAVVTAATLLYGAGLAVLNVALAIFNIGNWSAVIGMVALKVALIAASVATFAYSLFVWETAAATTVATGGTNLLIGALAVLASVILAAFVLGPIVAFGGAVWGAIRGIGQMIGSIGGLVPSVSSAASGIVGSFSSAWAATAAGFTTMLGTILTVGTQAFQALKDAFAVGDWQMMWDILKTSALLAWEQIESPLVALWTTLKDSATDVFYAIRDTLVDAFFDSWLAIKVLFVQGWAFIKAGAYESAADVMEATLGVSQGSRNLREQGSNALAAGDIAVGNLRIDDARSQDRRAEAAQRADRDWNEMYARTLRDAAAQQGNIAEVTRLQSELDALTMEAAIAAMDPSRWTLPEAPRVDSGMLGAGKFGSLGTFSSSFADMFGGSSTAADRTAQNTRDAADAARRGAAAAEGILQRIGRGLVVR